MICYRIGGPARGATPLAKESTYRLEGERVLTTGAERTHDVVVLHRIDSPYQVTVLAASPGNECNSQLHVVVVFSFGSTRTTLQNSLRQSPYKVN
jgi:hypothetical protein